MCDELTEIDNESFSNGGGALSRRDFSKLIRHSRPSVSLVELRASVENRG